MDTMRDRFASVASRLIDEEPRLAVVLADISTDRFRHVRRRHPDRVVNVGIREQLLVSVGGGLALAGLRPILHTYAPFLVERPFEQIKLDLGHQDVGAILVSIGASYDWTEGGRTHHSPGDVALIGTLPGWTIHVPGHADEVQAILEREASGSGRAYIRLGARMNGTGRPTGRGFGVIRRGTGPTIVAVGPMLDPLLAATADLDVSVLYAATIRPFDGATLRAVLATPDVVLVEPYLAGTSSGAVADALRDRPHRILALGVPRRELRRYGKPEEHDRAYGLHPAGIRASIDGFLGRPVGVMPRWQPGYETA